MLLMQQIQNETLADQQFAGSAYDYLKSNGVLGSFYDPVKFSMKVLDAHKASPSDALSTLVSKTDFSDAVDHDSIVKYGHDQAAGAVANDTKLTTDQKSEIADRTGQKLADAFVKSPSLSMGQITQLYTASYHSARSSVVGQPSAATTPPPQQQASAQPSNNTQPGQSSQQDPEDKVDKAVTKAQRAKNTADQLRGLFGH